MDLLPNFPVIKLFDNNDAFSFKNNERERFLNNSMFVLFCRDIWLEKFTLN